MKKRVATAAMTFGCVAALSLSAQADTFGPWTPKTAPVGEYDSNFYVTLGAGGFLQNTSNFNYFTAADSSALFLEAPDIIGGSTALTVGIVLDRRRKSSPMGNRPRVEFSFGYGRGSGDNTKAQTFPAGGFPFVQTSVDGTRVLGFGCGTVCTNTTSLSVDYQGVTGAVRLKTDIHLARNLYLTPAIGFVGDRSSVDYTIDSITSFVGVATVTREALNENLKTTRLGGELAADVTWKINGKWTLHGGASFALFRMGTRLNANDCLSSAVPVGAPCNGGTTQTSFSSFDHQTGYRVGMNTGVTYNGGWYKVTLVGQGVWDSDVPGVQNPSTTNFAVGATTGPARIVYSSQWRYGGFVAVAFPF